MRTLELAIETDGALAAVHERTHVSITASVVDAIVDLFPAAAMEVEGTCLIHNWRRQLTVIRLQP